MLQLPSSACPLLSAVGVSPGLFYFICKTSHLLNPWYLCQLWDLSVASNQGKYRACRPVKCSSTASAEYLAGLIWWFICMYFLGSCTHPRYSWAFGTLKQQCQHPDLRGIPSRYSSWGDRYGYRAQGTCAEYHQRRGEEGARDTVSPQKPIPPPLTLRSGKEGHRAFRETRPAHWTLRTTLREWLKDEELTWHSMLRDWRLSTTDISAVPKPK